MKTSVLLLAQLLIFCFSTHAAEDLRGVFNYVRSGSGGDPGATAACAGPSSCVYGNAHDANATTAVLQIRICWSDTYMSSITPTDPIFSGNCEALITANASPIFAVACSSNCHGFQYSIPAGPVGSISPRDGRRHYIYAKIISAAGAADRVIDFSPWPYTYISAVSAGPLWPQNLEANPARLTANQFAVLANSADVYSTGSSGGGGSIVCTISGIDLYNNGAAGYWMQKHGVPCDATHVVIANLPVALSIEYDAPGLVALQRAVNALPAAIQALAIGWVQPSVVVHHNTADGGRGITAFLSYGSFMTGTACYDGSGFGLGQGPYSLYFGTDSRAPYSDFKLRPSMLLAGGRCSAANCANSADPSNPSLVWTPDFTAFRNTVDAAVAAVDSSPAIASVFSVYSSDQGRSQTNISFSPASQGTPSPIYPSRITSSQQIGSSTSPVSNIVAAGISNALLYVNAGTTYGFSSATQKPFLPGAGVGVNVTSSGGNVPGDGNQSTALGWLAHGAVAAYGNAVEPCETLTAKNPDFSLFAANYAQGQTVLEALWKSVRAPWGGNFIGDPLASPFTLDPTAVSSAPPVLASVLNSASYASGSLAPGSIASLFGSGLTNLTAVGTLPLPSLLGGTSLTVTDGTGQSFAAPLFFVSPLQINFLVPPGPAAGAGMLAINAPGGTATLPVQITGTHGGLFSADGSGMGVAVGNVLRFDSNGKEIDSFLATCSLLVCSSVPISLGSPSDRTILVLYGTGIRNVASTSSVTVTVGGQPVNVLYAGAQGTLDGLDQINIQLPNSLAGMGRAQIQAVIGGQPLNPLGIVIQ